ncbi:unnamed protein product [Gongylonema pulchrum]|uniref:Uncharacterized protein n=1 Tax=Gongylonema pulchrum TaxID=637853 RepID=A0A183ETW3_9BILA|nr:unnamed protein product [Gongylonema pulchrum]VDN42793.1 unnamed protein product [Gongylonema pulchrum]
MHASTGIEETGEYVLSDPLEASLSDFYVTSPRSAFDCQLSSNSYPDSRSSQVFETIQESLSGRSSPASSRDAGSAHSPKGSGSSGTMNQKTENALVMEQNADEASSVEHPAHPHVIPDTDYCPMEVAFHIFVFLS